MTIIYFKKCPKCGYSDLKIGIECCPECGNEYIKDEINVNKEHKELNNAYNDSLSKIKNRNTISFKKCKKCGYDKIIPTSEICTCCGCKEIELYETIKEKKSVGTELFISKDGNFGIKNVSEYPKPNRNKGKSIIDIPTDYTLIDIETTGLMPDYDEIIELSALKIRNNQIKEQFTSLVKPKIKIDDFISELTGITNDMLINAPKIQDVISQFIDFISDDIVIGYNVNFDINFIFDNYKKCKNKEFSNNFVDIMRICKKHCNLPNHKLKTVCEFYNISTKGHHRGLNDCKIEFELLNKIYAELKEKYTDIKDFYKQNWYQEKAAKDIRTNNIEFNEDNYFYNKVCVFTGTLEIARKDAMQMVVDVGGKVSDTLNKETNILIVGTQDCLKTKENGKSNKMIKAEKYILKGQDLQIISENDFMELIHE